MPKRDPKPASFAVCTPVKTSQGNTHWFTLGRGWESTKNGKRRIMIKLNAHPVGRDLYLFEIDSDDEGDDDPELPDDDLSFLDDLPF